MTDSSDIATRIQRRTFLSRGGVGLGSLALASLISRDLQASRHKTHAAAYQGLPDLPHHTPRVKRVIFLCMAGGPSHLETFDYKPKLAEMDGRLTDDEWTRLEDMIVEMLRLRLHMRNEQFGLPLQPVPADMEEGRFEPMPFDYDTFWAYVDRRS